MYGAEDCDRCPLHETCQTVGMPPSLPSAGTPLFAVFGEAPGAEEDAQGKPFVGPSGRLLWEMLEVHGVYRSQAFVSNVVKCRPPQNRTPKVSELKRCAIWLGAELDWLRDEGCRYILALGAKAYNQLGGTGRITEQNGIAYEWQGFVVLPCVHPSAALRSPQAREQFKEGVAAFARLVKGGGPPKPPGTRTVAVRTAAEAQAMLEDLETRQSVAFDLETVGLDEQHERGKILCVSLSGETGKAYVAFPTPPVREALNYLFSLPKDWIAHNGRFDMRWLAEQGYVVPRLSHDTIIMAHLIDENAPKNVEHVATRYLGVASWKHLMEPYFRVITKSLEKGTDLPKVPAKDLVTYAGIDADIERRLAGVLWDKLDAKQRALHDLLVSVSHTLLGIERRGVYVDLAELERQLDHCQMEQQRAAARAGQVLGMDVHEVRLGSPKWLVDQLFGRLELPLVDLTTNGSPSTAEHSLKRLRAHMASEGDAAAVAVLDAILDYRKYQKFEGSYLRPWRALLNRDGRLRSSYNITGTVTGRLSCSNIVRQGMSLHQVPRDADIRSVIAAPPGRCLIVADYSQIELRVAAAFSGDSRMIEAYRKRQDLHTLTASVITGKPLKDVTKEDRTKAKSVNFGFLYGMGAKNFVTYAFDEYGLTFSLSEAERIRDAFFETYRGLRDWHLAVEREVRRQGCVRSPLGRIRHLPDIYSTDKGLQYEAVRQAINSPVQATASDFTLLAMVMINDLLCNDSTYLVGQVHDSLLLECEAEQADILLPQILDIMSTAVPAEIERRFSYRFPVPLAAEAEVYQRWGVPVQKIQEMLA